MLYTTKSDHCYACIIIIIKQSWCTYSLRFLKFVATSVPHLPHMHQLDLSAQT